MSTDNRTIINDCDANTGWTGDDTATAISDAGSFIEGSGGLSTQLSNADEQMHTTQDSVGASTFSLDWSDSTLYMNIKDNLGNSYTNGGYQFVVGDAADLIGYFVGGNDAIGMPGQFYFAAFKLDVSEVVASPGTADVDFTEFTGTEANLDQTVCTRIGYGSLHLAKAVGSVDNVIMDGFYYIANGSYALTINGGTSGTPETMTDVFGDDNTNGWNLIANPLGAQYQFFGPTEWGEASASSDHYFTADGEQWFWIGDNSGGKAVGATHFPFRVLSNGTVTNSSFVIDNVVIVNTGTGAEFDCSNTDMDTLEIDGCSISGLASFNAPSSGGTSRFCTNTIFSNCGQITHNGADMSGSSVLTSTVDADTGALVYNETSDPDTVMDGMTFSKGTNAHHAIDFGTNVSSEITLRNIEFSGFGTTEDGNDAALRFLNTTGAFNVNIIGCTVDGSAASPTTLYKDDAAAATEVTLVFDPVTTLINIKDLDGNNESGVNVYLEAADATGDLPFEQSITSITRSGTTATVTFAAAHGLVSNEYIKLYGITDTDNQSDLSGAFQVTVTGSTTLTYTTATTGPSPYNGTLTGTGATIYGTTDASGNISSSRTYGSNQPLTGYARKSDDGVNYFKAIDLDDTVNSTTGLTINRRLVSDGLV